MRNRLIYTFVGMCAGLGFVASRLLWRAFSSERVWWIQWTKDEIFRHGGFYVVLTLFAVTMCVIVGYWLGNSLDDFRNEAQAVGHHNLTLNTLATTDQLTGLFNMRYMRECLDVELENSHRSSLTCLMIDIDHFKRINDTFGHLRGDEVLIRVARTLKSSLRLVDMVGRVGGEEFLVVLPSTGHDRAMAIGERIRQAVQADKIEGNGKTIRMTVSVGVVTTPAPELKNKEDLIKAADDALYAAKRSGRNKVVVWRDMIAPPPVVS